MLHVYKVTFAAELLMVWGKPNFWWFEENPAFDLMAFITWHFTH